MPIHQNARQCTHIKVNGLRCGSPALRGFTHCYFHQVIGDELENPEERDRIRPLEDAESIQLGLLKIVRMLQDERIDSRRAGLCIWALQIAAYNLRRTEFDPDPDDVITDLTLGMPKLPKPE